MASWLRVVQDFLTIMWY